LANKVGRVDCYYKRGEYIVQSKGYVDEVLVHIESIATWWYYPKMTFDIVCIRMVDGNVWRWCDTNGELLALMRSELGDRELDMGSGEA